MTRHSLTSLRGTRLRTTLRGVPGGLAFLLRPALFLTGRTRGQGYGDRLVPPGTGAGQGQRDTPGLRRHREIEGKTGPADHGKVAWAGEPPRRPARLDHLRDGLP